MFIKDGAKTQPISPPFGHKAGLPPSKKYLLVRQPLLFIIYIFCYSSALHHLFFFSLISHASIPAQAAHTPRSMQMRCKADSHIANDSRKHSSRCNTENQFNDAGCKWRPAVSHTLDSRAIDLQHSKKQVKRRYGQQIVVRIPDDLCCRLTYKHRHYQMTAKMIITHIMALAMLV